MYVDSLIGPDTVTRLPEATIALFEDHGRLARTIDVNVEEAEDMMSRLGAVSVDLDNVGLALDTEGVVSFHESVREVLAALEAKARQFTRH